MFHLILAALVISISAALAISANEPITRLSGSSSHSSAGLFERPANLRAELDHVVQGGLKPSEQPTDLVGVFGLLLHKAHERTPLVDGEFERVRSGGSRCRGVRGRTAFYTTRFCPVPTTGLLPVDAALGENSSATESLTGGETLDCESLHEFSVGLALARNHQDRIGNPLPVARISRTHPQFHAGRFERCVHGFDLSIVEEFPHSLPRSKGPDHRSIVRPRALVVCRTNSDPAALSVHARDVQMIAAILQTCKPGWPPGICHPGCCRAAARGAATPSLYARR